MTDSKTEWRTYEEVAQYLLDRIADKFGLQRVEGKQSVTGLRSGTSWEIDGKGVYADGATFLILECRRYTTSRVKQEAMGAIAYRIIDTAAKGAIVVSPMDPQAGAQKIAAAENITSVQLTEDSTTANFVLRLLNEIHMGFSDTVGPIMDAVGIVMYDAKTGAVLETRGDANVVSSVVERIGSADDMATDGSPVPCASVDTDSSE